jgi:hypothetical protein
VFGILAPASETCTLLAEATDERVFSPRARKRAIAICPTHSDIIGLELSLAHSKPELVGLSVGAVRQEACRAFADSVRTLAPTSARLARASEVLQTIHGARGSAVYLEYDWPAGTCSLPSLFIRTNDLVGPGANPASRPALGALMRALLLRDEWTAVRPALRQLGALVPTEYLVSYLGATTSRANELLRVGLGLPMPCVAHFLERTVGAAPAQAAGIAELAERAGWIDLAIGIGRAGIRPRVGIELTPRAGQAEAVLRELSRRGFVNRDLLATLVGWLAAPGGRVERSLSHVKIDFDAGTAQAKAYLGVAAAKPGTCTESQTSGRAIPCSFSGVESSSRKREESSSWSSP